MVSYGDAAAIRQIQQIQQRYSRDTADTAEIQRPLCPRLRTGNTVPDTTAIQRRPQRDTDGGGGTAGAAGRR
eukprot:4051995-Prymnesium_polylepis.1